MIGQRFCTFPFSTMTLPGMARSAQMSPGSTGGSSPSWADVTSSPDPGRYTEPHPARIHSLPGSQPCPSCLSTGSQETASWRKGLCLKGGQDPKENGRRPEMPWIGRNSKGSHAKTQRRNEVSRGSVQTRVALKPQGCLLTRRTRQ